MPVDIYIVQHTPFNRNRHRVHRVARGVSRTCHKDFARLVPFGRRGEQRLWRTGDGRRGGGPIYRFYSRSTATVTTSARPYRTCCSRASRHFALGYTPSVSMRMGRPSICRHKITNRNARALCNPPSAPQTSACTHIYRTSSVCVPCQSHS